jgi:hypothetical protein
MQLLNRKATTYLIGAQVAALSVGYILRSPDCLPQLNVKPASVTNKLKQHLSALKQFKERKPA